MDVCGAKNRQGNPCQRHAGAGTSHKGHGRCSNHGGSSPQAELAGVVALVRAEQVVMGRPVDIEPHEAILRAVRIAWGEVEYASEKIAELSAAVGPVVTTKVRPLSLGKEGESSIDTVEEVTTGPPALHIWIQARHLSMDRAVNYSKIALAAGVEERRVRAAEQWAAGYIDQLKRLVVALGHDLEDPGTREIVVRHLTLLEGGTAA